ncbi:hypothetical protein, partial [Escherichia coli]|uniref:hypothetical protein n=1 Tax=Escherichia coli TaxID=562 RepID=UPI00200CA843
EEKKEGEESKPGFVEKLRRSNSSSSSSSDEENAQGEKKKKGFKEKLTKNKVTAADKEEGKIQHGQVLTQPEETEEKKGFLEKIKEKIPAKDKKADEPAVVYHPTETKVP